MPKRGQKSFNVHKCKVINLGQNNLNHACTVLNSDPVVTNQERDLGAATTSPEAAKCAGQVKEAKKLLGIARNGIKTMTPSACT